MNPDERLHSDAQLLEALLEGRASEGDSAARELFARRPDWREVFDHAQGAAWSGEASEADRRLVAECLAQARTPSAPLPARRPWTKWLALAAATLLVAWLARLWLADEKPPVRPKGAVLESTGEVGFFESGDAAKDYSRFAWTSKGLAQGELFVLTIWALDASGERGLQLFREQTDASFREVPPDTRAAWPDRVIWRVACIETSGFPKATREWFAERSRH